METKTSSLRAIHLIKGWGGILTGRAPLMSIEITRECPLSCPGCYAYNDTHLGGEKNLRDLSDFKGDELVERVIALVRRHRPLHVSLVGGEPMMRHRELNKIIPALSNMGVFTMVVTSGVIPIPQEWMKTPHSCVTVSVDGLPEHHDVRRKPATYERILRNIVGCKVNVHWTITHPMVQRPGYREEYVRFWSERPEVDFIWTSFYSPQAGEVSPEMLIPADRDVLVRELPDLHRKYPKFLMNEGLAQTYNAPPRNPNECIFSRMSVNYTADMKTRVEPCIFGGNPDCSQCGCAISVALHWIGHRQILGPVTVGHLVRGSVGIGALVAHLRPERREALRWERHLGASLNRPTPLVQVLPSESEQKAHGGD
jgi:organic radical activating enzyme